MPSDLSPDIDSSYPAGPFSGRCACGATCITVRRAPRLCYFTHDRNVRRWTGAPVVALGLCADGDVGGLPGAGLSAPDGSTLWNCRSCGAPVALRPVRPSGQVHVALGLLDAAILFAPQIHIHAESRLPWMLMGDDLPRIDGSGDDLMRLAMGHADA